jgi:hypothetical protein
VLLGTSSIRRPRRRLLNKDKKMMLYSKAKFIMSSWDKKLNSEPNDDGRFASSPIAQMLLLPAVV